MKIIKNRKYCGDAVWNQLAEGKHHAFQGGKVVRKEGGKDKKRPAARRNDPADVFVTPGRIPAIVSRDLWERANTVQDRAPVRTARKGGKASYLFREMLICGDCGFTMYGVPTVRGKAYHCSRYNTYGRTACHCNAVYEKPLLEAILAEVLGSVLNPDRLDEIEAEMKRRLDKERSPREIGRLKRELAGLEKDIAQAGRNLARSEGETFFVVERELVAMRKEHETLARRVEQLESGTTAEHETLAEARRQLSRLRDGLLNDDPELQAAIISEVVTKAEVQFRHEETHGKRSRSGKGRPVDIPVRAILTVKPGLGLSVLSTPAGRPF
jgi:site-specific DNA recombinase